MFTMKKRAKKSLICFLQSSLVSVLFFEARLSAWRIVAKRHRKKNLGAKARMSFFTLI
jgi:hypothetical protein